MTKRLPVAALFLAVLLVQPAPRTRAGADRPPLDEILGKLSRVAAVYLQNAKQFSCLEVVRWKTYGPAGRTVEDHGKLRSSYLFAGRQGELLEEIRAPRRVRSLEEIDLHVKRSHVPLYMERAYFWILLFDDEHQGRYAYEIDEYLTESGLSAVRLRFRPDPPAETGQDEWHGSAVIDLESYQILGAEGHTSPNYRRLQRFEAWLDSSDELPVSIEDRTFVVAHWSTEFGVERDGLRLPSEARAVKKILRVRGAPGARKSREIVIHEIRQIYKDYRFYDVSTHAEVREDRVEPEAVPEPLEEPRELAASSSPVPGAPAGLPDKVVYHEPFDLPADDPDVIFDWEELGWLLGSDDRGIWKGSVEGGNFQLANVAHEGEVHVQTFAGLPGVTSSISAKVKLQKRKLYPRPAAGLLYRFRSDADRDANVPAYYAFLLTHRGEARFVRRTESGFYRLYEAPVEGFRWDHFVELAVAGEGDELTLFVDGRQVATVQDAELPSGAPGIVAIGRGEYAFDDLRLQGE